MTQESSLTTPRLLGLRTLKGALQRLSVTMLLMLLTTMTAWADEVTYINANGHSDSHYAIPLSGGESSLNTGWYYVGNDITYDGTIDCHGDVHIILADGKTMTITSSDGYGIYVHSSLTIYGQAKGTGTLNATGDDQGIYSPMGSITICGGTVNVTSKNDGIYTNSGDITISGGRVTATSEYATGISTDFGTITLGCTTASDFIYASSYGVGGHHGKLKIADGQTLYDEDGTEYSGDDITIPDGVTLCSFFPHVIAQYIDAAGKPARCAAIALDGRESTLGEYEQETWYYVDNDITYDRTIDCLGDVHIILADGKTMTINSGSNGIDVHGSLTIYGQAKGTGTLNATGKCGIFSYSDSITIFGGTVNATGDNNGIHSDRGTITISGGRVNATGDKVGIYTYSGTITISGGTVTVTSEDGAGINSNSGTITISGGTVNVTNGYVGIYTNSGNITICGGTVNATGYDVGIYTNSGTITISGGRVTAIGDGEGIHNQSGDITISGGRVTATGEYGDGIFTYSGTITLGCTTASDFIKVSSYIVGSQGTLKIANGQTLYDEDGNTYSGDDITIPDGVTLCSFPTVLVYDTKDNSEAISGSDNKQRNVILYGRTLFKDGEWNTLCLPFDVSTISEPLSGDNVQAMILNNSEGSGTGFDASTGVLTLNFSEETEIPAGTPFIIRWGTPDDNPGTALTDPVFKGVTIDNSDAAIARKTQTSTDGTVSFKGTYAKQEYTQENKSILLLGAENTLYWPQPDGDTYPSIGAFRAYFELGGGQEAREFVLNFNESETTSLLNEELRMKNEEFATAAEWFTLDGRKLSDKPTKKGLYIHGGRKVVIP